MLNFNNITYKRNDQWELPKCSANIKPGEFWWIKGDNGSGKSTLLKLLYGLFKPDSGQIDRCESLICHYIGHEPFFKPYRQVGAQLKDWITLLNLNIKQLKTNEKIDSDEAVNSCLNHWGCIDYKNSLYGSLSMGQKKRVDLCLLTHQFMQIPHVNQTAPILWLVDEPLSCLDHDAQSLFWGHVNTHLSTGGSVIFTSHQTQIPLVPTLHILDLHAQSNCHFI